MGADYCEGRSEDVRVIIYVIILAPDVGVPSAMQ